MPAIDAIVQSFRTAPFAFGSNSLSSSMSTRISADLREARNIMAEHGALKGEDVFFEALPRGDSNALRALLTTDFLLIDAMSGSEIPGDIPTDLVGSRQLRFESVERVDSRVRQYGNAAVVAGQTRMRGTFGDEGFEAHRRHTHVYVRNNDAWQLASAQGTPIATAGEET